MDKRGATIEVIEVAEASAAPQASECCPSILTAPLEDEEAAELARGFFALADPVRLRVLSILASAAAGEVCVCAFVSPLGKAQPTVSHHLKILGEAGLIHGERRGKWVWYSLDRARLANLRAALDA
jgi:ArsR family transcriptional regulator, arsenate/arsenite/antimonite-responsive transcriptional repressor